MAYLGECHVVAATKLRLSVTHGVFLLGGKKVIGIHEPLGFDQHGSPGLPDLDKITFLQAEVPAHVLRDNHLPALPHAANGGGSFSASDCHTVRIADNGPSVKASILRFSKGRPHGLDRPRRNHVLQVGGYARLVEDVMQKPVPAAFIYMAPRNQLVRVIVTDGLKDLVRARLHQMRDAIREQFLPGPTPARARCEECEFRNYCGDIF